MYVRINTTSFPVFVGGAETDGGTHRRKESDGTTPMPVLIHETGSRELALFEGRNSGQGVVNRMGLANARREEWEMLGDEVVLDAVGKQMIRKIPNTLSKRRGTVAKNNLMDVGLSHDEFRHGGKRKMGFGVKFRGEFERVVYDRCRVVELFNERQKACFTDLSKGIISERSRTRIS